MKMRKNGLEGDAFAISRIPIRSPPCMKREGDRLCAARRRERPVQVHPPHHPAEAVAEPVDGVDAREQTDIKPGAFLPLSQNHVWSLWKWNGPSTQTQTHPDSASPTCQTTKGSSRGVGPGLPLGILKAGYGITKAIGDHQTKRAIAIGEKRRREVASGKRKRYAGESFNCSIM